MEIAFLGWGSLVWCPLELKVKGEWNKDGPLLPIELRRLSKCGRITFVLHPGAKDVQTLWVYAVFKDLDRAIENLREREETITKRIGFLSMPNGEHRCKVVPDVLDRIREWAVKKGLDAVIWTDLPENPDKFKKKTKMELTEDNIIKYLKSLEGETLEKAKEYVQKAPKQIDTKLRHRIKQELEW